MSTEQLVTLAVTTIFFAGGMWAYGRAAWRLHRLRRYGEARPGRVLAKRKEEISDQGLMNLLVTYEFPDRSGAPVTHTVDVERGAFYDSFNSGDEIEIVSMPGDPGRSYPARCLDGNLRVYAGIAAALLPAYVLVNLLAALWG